MHTSDTDAIRAADQAFYTALSGRDIQAMARVWADKPYVVCIGPRSKVMNVGFDAVKKYWEWAFDFFSQIAVSKSDRASDVP
jgi:ketosteroid isomerase-like protein